jgi:hypothetical protein
MAIKRRSSLNPGPSTKPPKVLGSGPNKPNINVDINSLLANKDVMGLVSRCFDTYMDIQRLKAETDREVSLIDAETRQLKVKYDSFLEAIRLQGQFNSDLLSNTTAISLAMFNSLPYVSSERQSELIASFNEFIKDMLDRVKNHNQLIYDHNIEKLT